MKSPFIAFLDIKLNEYSLYTNIRKMSGALQPIENIIDNTIGAKISFKYSYQINVDYPGSISDQTATVCIKLQKQEDSTFQFKYPPGFLGMHKAIEEELSDMYRKQLFDATIAQLPSINDLIYEFALKRSLQIQEEIEKLQKDIEILSYIKQQNDLLLP